MPSFKEAMASIRHRGDIWQVQVSKKGLPPESRTFTSKADARCWATETEATMFNLGQNDGMSLGFHLVETNSNTSPEARSSKTIQS